MEPLTLSTAQDVAELACAAAPASGDIAVARRVLQTEAEGLLALAASLDGAFERAVALLHGCAGRVVVSGMGKSGHVGRKIAATLSSTGTPSMFVHPAEASHGDLGMIVEGDVVLALSNSGETAELADLVAHTRRFALALVAITGRAGSTLARQADVALVLPASPEACPMGLAPTTSTTSQLALGDALAVALLTRRGFGASDFRMIHPGGKLGARLRRVRDVMHGPASLPLGAGVDSDAQRAADHDGQAVRLPGRGGGGRHARRDRDRRRSAPRHGPGPAGPHRRCAHHDLAAPDHWARRAGGRGAADDERQRTAR